MIDFQSLATALRPCPSGTFENGQQHTRVIYGGVHRPQMTRSPAGTTETLLGVATWCPSWLCGSNVSIQGYPRPFKAIKGYPSLFKGFWKKIFLWKAGGEKHPGALRVPSAPLQAMSGQIRLSQPMLGEKIKNIYAALAFDLQTEPLPPEDQIRMVRHKNFHSPISQFFAMLLTRFK
ncbi:MAG TPA: hypothetical protein VNU95_01870 [Candidatus Acidoferrales bacterium]|jgi:hypothetical protein|nr:hypothetical protein [Candidatus Acidoferrales bacterium]